MAWYDTGTVNVTNGSTTVVGVGTNFIAGAQVGEGFYGPDNRLYEIQAIVSATSLTLADVYLGTTQTGQGYKIVPTQSLVAALATQVSTLISDFQGVVDEAGSGKFNDGTAASAGITFTLDQDTGIFRPAANQIGFTTAGVQRAVVSNTGLDVTGTVTAGDVDITGPTPTLRLTDDDVASEYTKIYNNSGNVFIDSRNGTNDGQFIVRGEGGGVVTEHFRANANGVGIFNTNPTAALDVVGTTELNGNTTVDGTFTVQGSTGSIFLTDTDVSASSRIWQTGENLYIDNQSIIGGDTYFRTDNGKIRQLIRDNGDISWRNTAGTVDGLYWDAADMRLGLGTTSPSAALDVVGDAEINGNLTVVSASPVMTITETDANAAYQTTQLGVETGNFLIQTRNSAGTFVSNDYIINKDATGANSQQWRIGNQTKLFLNSVGLGIGTTSPTQKLEVAGNILMDSAGASLVIKSGAVGTTGSVDFTFSTESTSFGSLSLPYDTRATVGLLAQSSSSYPVSISSGTAPSANNAVILSTSGTERMRIDSSGNVGIATSSPDHRLHVPSGNIFAGSPVTSFPAVDTSGSGAGLLSAGVIAGVRDDYSLTLNRHTTTGSVAQFYYSGAFKGSISVTGSGTAFNTSSDYRLKENITPVQGAADIVKAMQPVTYTFKSDGSWHDGFLAHELQELHPRAVIGEKDAMKDEEYEVTPAVYEDVVIPAVEAVVEVPAVYDDEGALVSEMVPAVEAQPERTEQQLVSEAVMGTRSVPDYQGVDYSKLTPILTAALQEALNKIDALEARLTALEGV